MYWYQLLEWPGPGQATLVLFHSPTTWSWLTHEWILRIVQAISPFIVIHGCLRICFNDGRVSGLILTIVEIRSLASVETRVKQTQKKLWTSPGFLLFLSGLKIAGQIKKDLQDKTSRSKMPRFVKTDRVFSVCSFKFRLRVLHLRLSKSSWLRSILNSII